MAINTLNPGDRVVALAELLLSVAVFTGAISAAWLLWLVKRSWLASTCAFITGGVLGLVVGHFVAGFLYRGPGRATTVVKVGAAALPSTVRAGLAGGISASFVVALLVLLIFRPKDSAALFPIALGCGAVLGIIFGILSPLV